LLLRKNMMRFLDGHPLAATLATLPSATWAAALGIAEPLPITLLDLSSLASAITPLPLATVLSASEQTRYHGFRFPKRQQEWLGGRLAAKAAVALLLAPSGSQPLPPALVITADPAGKPLLDLPGLALPVHLSISHSHDRAAAMASHHPCGLDLQAITPAVLRVQERFATPAEEKILAMAFGGEPAMARLTLLWAAKEALRKMVPLSPLLSFHDAVLREAQPAGAAHLLLFSCAKICHNAPHPLRVVATLSGDYALAVSVLPSTAPTAPTAPTD
jgi:4'-phosphopantetheinyl transferase EntD